MNCITEFLAHVIKFKLQSIEREMRVLTDEKRGTYYTVSEYLIFLAVWTMFDTFYFQIFCWKQEKIHCYYYWPWQPCWISDWNGKHPRNIPAKFCSNWPSGFGEEVWNVKSLQTTDDRPRTPSDGNSSHGTLVVQVN